MFKKKKKDSPEKNPIVTGFINMIFEVFKHFIKDFENFAKAKKVDKFDNKFNTLERMVIDLKTKIQDNYREIDELKNRILWGNIVIVVLLLVNIFMMIEKF